MTRTRYSILVTIDVHAAKTRGIRIENTSHILAEDVANAAVGLALAVTRDFIYADTFVRAGAWPEHGQYPLGRSISRMKIGFVGLGTIGSATAKRLQAFARLLRISAQAENPSIFRTTTT